MSEQATQQRGGGESRPPAQHAPPIASEKIVQERKVFFLDLKENQRGRFIKMTEDVGGRRDTVMIPIEAVTEIAEALTRLHDYHLTLEGGGY